ncbi:MAG: biotin--[acetyl-CoA-carboxylase] ligase [Actinomycetota bacterium]
MWDEVRWYAEVTSTNSVAADWADAGAPEGSVVVAASQTAGRGRLDRVWYGAPGETLMFSMVLRPTGGLPASLSLAAGVAACEVIRGLGLDASVKWPNDVLVGAKKICGILGEVHVDAVILGVGMNINTDEFPSELKDAATSLLLESGRPHDLKVVLKSFLSRFEDSYLHPETLLMRYRQMCSTLGKHVQVEMPRASVQGLAVDIDESGGLVLDDGTVVHAGDITHVR